MNTEQQLTSTRLWITVLNLDLQLYKGSIYKQRWGTPGGIDQALPCYDEALLTLDRADWPPELRTGADDLRQRVAAYRASLEGQDVTTASALHTRMLMAFNQLRAAVRHWPELAPVTSDVTALGASARLSMDEVVPNG
jgi:hypothetical protein